VNRERNQSESGSGKARKSRFVTDWCSRARSAFTLSVRLASRPVAWINRSAASISRTGSSAESTGARSTHSAVSLRPRPARTTCSATSTSQFETRRNCLVALIGRGAAHRADETTARWQASSIRTDASMARCTRRSGRVHEPRERTSVRREVLASILVDRMFVFAIPRLRCIQRAV
jgi:hypothetical protein